MGQEVRSGEIADRDGNEPARQGPGLMTKLHGEWLNLWAHEIPDVTGVGRIGPAMELATVPGIHKELDGAA